MPRLAVAFFICCAMCALAGIANGAATLITHAQVVDGTGARARAASVRVEGERISAVGDIQPKAGDTIIDARGLTLAPGFIDTHSHHEEGVFGQRSALAAVSQGITTIVIGQDGGLVEPFQYYFERVKREPVAVHIAAYAGHGTIRRAVLGEDYRRPATTAEIERMRKLLRKAMRDGALGLSTGLEYDPGIYAKREELIALAHEAARSDGRYISHIRSEDRHLWEAVEEAIDIARQARIPVQISHVKLAMLDWWGQADRLIAMLERARSEGIDITADIYPYEYWQTTMTVLFPERDFSSRTAAELALRTLVRPQDLRISRFSPDPSLEGRTLDEIAHQRGTDPATALTTLTMQAQVPGAQEQVIGKSMDENDIARLIAWPHSNICSDGALSDAHPRGAGSFTRVLRKYVREKHLLTQEEAIRKMTSASARHVGIEGRGVIRPGAYADLVLFDTERVGDRATLENPGELSDGIEKVWVNGTIVFANGVATGAYPGRIVHRAGR